MLRLPLTLLAAFVAVICPTAAFAARTPALSRAALEPAGTATILHVELTQAPGAVRRAQLHGSGRAIALRPIRRRGGRTTWHTSPLPTAMRGALDRGSGRLRLTLRDGSTLTLRVRLSAAPATPVAPSPPAHAPADPGRRVEITAEPAITPALAADTSDHVVRCTGAAPVRVEVDSTVPVRVDDADGRTGRFAASVALQPGQAFSVAVDGVEHRVRCLPADFPTSTVERLGPQEPLGYLVTPVVFHPGTRYAAVLDRHGTPIWWMAPPAGVIDLRPFPGGRLAWSRFGGGAAGLSPDGAYEIRRPDGTLERTITAVAPLATDHHDLQLLPGGDALLIGYRPRDNADLSPWGWPSDATVLDAVIQRIRPDGSLAWEWDGGGHVALGESARLMPLQILPSPLHAPDGTAWYDTAHANSVEPDGDGTIVSLRNADAVYRIDNATGEVDWKLGGTPTSRSLTVVGDPLDGAFGGQHDARRLADGTVSIFDNGSARDRPPRVARYAIDPATRTATLVQSFGDPAVPFSVCCGGARRTPGGHWVVAWGGTPRFTETTADGTVVFALTFSGSSSTYRAVPLLPGDVSPAALRAGMDARFPRG